jgi:hypothetical protein
MLERSPGGAKKKTQRRKPEVGGKGLPSTATVYVATLLNIRDIVYDSQKTGCEQIEPCTKSFICANSLVNF